MPIVSLSHKANLEIVTNLACALFMGGRPMGRHALNILASVLEEMLSREQQQPEALQFMLDQILQHAPSTPDMLKGARKFAHTNQLHSLNKRQSLHPCLP